ncbi:MAG TPA: folylpolyglutamate synthase/dihydrofolate synthase family protein [Opitutaceae bacterium]|nr:folylpolyglutamate synthase/dihydrofolate synthase family protein [Opitutaceae bacterium]
MHVAPLNDYAAVQDYLFSLKANGVKFGVDRMRSWIDALGHPELRTPCIHIAGTNGKGSTAAMLATIYQTYGCRVGLYTSPHLVRLGERVQVNRQHLTEAEIVNFTNELRPVAEKVSALNPDDHPSFFEFMTAMAFLQFARKKCDISVIEVGLGGRLDATNVVMPEVAVITSISLDHCEMLGNTIEEIAREKAGIIKRGRPVVLGHLPPEAEKVIREIAAELNAPVHSIAEEFGTDISNYPETRLEGDYQRWNAATAALAVKVLRARWPIPADVVAKALHAVNWPGRWESVQLGGRPLILDASHNPEGAAVLDIALQKLVAEFGRRPVVITGVLGAARAAPLIETICRYAREIHFVVPNQARACSHEELIKLVPASFQGRIARATLEGLFPNASSCTAGGPDDVVVVTGSIYLLGEVLARIQPQRGANESRLQDF